MVIAENNSSQGQPRSERSRTLSPAMQVPDIFADPPLPNTLPSPDGKPLEQSRRTYMKQFIKRYPKAWEAWEKGGLLQSPETRNIIEHHVVAAVIGRIIAKNLDLSVADQDAVTMALLVHDADKLQEKQALLEAAGKENSLEHATAALSAGHALLEGIVSNKIRRLSEANVPDEQNVSSDIKRQIVHYVDTILDGSRLTSPEGRMRAGASENGRRDNRVAALQYQVREHALGLAEGEYPELQIKLATEEAERFAAAINQNTGRSDITGKNLHEKLQELFDQEVEAFAA